MWESSQSPVLRVPGDHRVTGKWRSLSKNEILLFHGSVTPFYRFWGLTGPGTRGKDSLKSNMRCLLQKSWPCNRNVNIQSFWIYHKVFCFHMNSNMKTEHALGYRLRLCSASVASISSPLYSTTKSPCLKLAKVKMPRPEDTTILETQAWQHCK